MVIKQVFIIYGSKQVTVHNKEVIIQAIHKRERPNRTKRLVFHRIRYIQTYFLAIPKKCHDQLRQMIHRKDNILKTAMFKLPKDHLQYRGIYYGD